ncbi:hypothetical protein NIES4102_41700 (plasmid) [Chondrocystis sp. NIES-4102]|nr:hypothetical protein NIES4102_41700 [Chondrocystis sp. NIES-4102]
MLVFASKAKLIFCNYSLQNTYLIRIFGLKSKFRNKITVNASIMIRQNK